MIDPDNVSVKFIFGEGNIIEGSYKLDYIPLNERRNFRCVVQYRLMEPNKQASKASILVRWNETNSLPVIGWDGGDPRFFQNETFDLSQFCTSREHALKVARYLLSIRRRITHVVNFKTLPDRLGLGPGDIIRINTQNFQVNTARMAVARASDGKLLTPTPLDDGEYEVALYDAKQGQVITTTVEIIGNVLQQQEYWGAVFASIVPGRQNLLYQIEEIGIGEDGLVDITASHYPVRAKPTQGQVLQSIVTLDVLDSDPADPLFYYSTDT